VICVENRQRRVRLDLHWLRRLANHAFERCGGPEIDPKGLLTKLAEIDVAIVSDRRMAKVHREFMGIPGPTDVITFHHGEIVISADTAQGFASEYGQTVDREVARYLIHGLLHLAGYDDHTTKERARMHRLQERVLRACLLREADR
jgi:probable rRNA maturation factor